MGKKVKRTEVEQVKQAQEAEAKAHGAKAEAKAEDKAPKHAVRVLEFLKHLNLDWLLERPLEESDLTILNAQVSADNSGTEWASWWQQYKRADGTPVKGISWGVSAPVSGGFVILRLFDSGEAKAVLRIYGNGKGILTGVEPVVKALLARPDIQPWTDQDTAALL